MKQSKIYKAEYADYEMEVFSFCGDDLEALQEAKSKVWVHGILFNLFELNENYEEIRTIY